MFFDTFFLGEGEGFQAYGLMERENIYCRGRSGGSFENVGHCSLQLFCARGKQPGFKSVHVLNGFE